MSTEPLIESEVRRPNWWPAIATAFSVWGGAAIGYVLINMMVWMTRNEAGPLIGGMLEVWDQWDTGHYVNIAQHGYNPNSENPAFFPLYSIFIRYLDPVLPGGTLGAGLTISNISTIIALTFLYKLIEELYGAELARRTTWYLMAYPFAFFLSAAYNEAFFLMFVVTSWYCMRQSMWWTAGLLGAMASATRQAGVLLALAFVVEYLRQRNWRLSKVDLNALAVAVFPAGIIAYSLYCWRAFGDPLKFVHVQAAWGREPTWPWLGTIRAIELAADASRDGYIFQPVAVLNIIDSLAVVVTLILLVLSVVGPWRLGRDSLFLIVSSATSFLVVLVSPIGLGVPLHGVPRYVLETVPAFMVLAKMGANRHLERLYLMPAVLTQGVLLLSFYYDIWIA